MTTTWRKLAANAYAERAAQQERDNEEREREYRARVIRKASDTLARIGFPLAEIEGAQWGGSDQDKSIELEMDDVVMLFQVSGYQYGMFDRLTIGKAVCPICGAIKRGKTVTDHGNMSDIGAALSDMPRFTGAHDSGRDRDIACYWPLDNH